ncbi:hypothetical protein BS47DRAFT_1343719 [Hydnum rufescens UP504]|uniref:DRBM domain-containing protein n=1 Tax=Hydnum rufescens UP504 TaxID=1448309 RepID=A0A9P6AY16_9AGAM|nr:hypothetical protein BS47DRAFT_1343719 [Hydnum rufescens UP504]
MDDHSSTGGYTRQLHNLIQGSRGLHKMNWEERVSGADHNQQWIVTVYIDDAPLGTASGSRKNVAKDRAAREALIALGVIDG